MMKSIVFLLGWEKAETEAMALKQQFDTVTQQKLALEDRVSHLDGALKECMKQLQQVREENEDKIHKVVTEKAIEWDKIKFQINARIVELEKLLLEEKKSIIQWIILYKKVQS